MTRRDLTPEQEAARRDELIGHLTDGGERSIGRVTVERIGDEVIISLYAEDDDALVRYTRLHPVIARQVADAIHLHTLELDDSSSGDPTFGSSVLREAWPKWRAVDTYMRNANRLVTPPGYDDGEEKGGGDET